MHRKKSRVVLLGLFFLVMILSTKDSLSAYVEGIDTTDVNGYVLDSAFNVATNGKITSSFPAARYGLGAAAVGLFNYSFDDIKIACASMDIWFNTNSGPISYTCFVIKKKDSTYTKVQILKKLADNRHVFKYGTNNAPYDRMLVKTDYDRSIRCKPNNVRIQYEYPGKETLFWEPPLPNNNHLLGYIFYQSKSGIVIDTSAPINPAQWDSVAFIDSTILKGSWAERRYLNLVAVYAEGKSDFLEGWSYFAPTVDGIKRFSPVPAKIQTKINVKKSPSGFLFNFPPSPDNSGLLSLGIYNISGQRIADFLNVTGNHLFWNPSLRNLPEGTYVIKAELPDRSVINQPFMLTR